MNRTLNDEEKRMFRKLLAVIGVSMLLFSLFMRVMFRFNGISEKYKISQNDRIHGVVEHADGSEDVFQGNSFRAVRRGDILRLYIDHPSANPYGIGASLCLFATDCMIDAYCGDRLIYQQDRTDYDRGIMPHNSFHVISLPPDYEAQEVMLEITPVDIGSFTTLNVWLSPNGHSVKSILVGKEFSFVLLITLSMVSAGLTLLLAVLSLARKRLYTMLPLALFCFLIVMWNFGTQGFLYLLSDTQLASMGEYIFLYASCIPLSIYMAVTIKDRLTKRIMQGFVLFFTGLFAVACAAAFSPAKAGFSTTLPFLHIGAVLMMVTYFAASIRDHGEMRSFPQQIEDGGFRVCLVLGVLEFVRYYFVNYIGTSIQLLHTSLGPLAIAALVLALVMSAGCTFIIDYFEKVEQEHLRKLAYQDNLTGIPNRSACYAELEKLKKQGIKDYTMLFIDLNHLKQANDMKGHEAGDRMLVLTAEAMKTAFEGKGFYGRWGGDEFIACITGAPQLAKDALAEFRDAIRKLASKEENLPFGLSAAAGCAESSAEHPLMPIEAVNQADDAMYVDKKRMRAERKA